MATTQTSAREATTGRPGGGDGGLQPFAEFIMAVEAVESVTDDALRALADECGGAVPSPPDHLLSPELRRAFVAVVQGLQTLRRAVIGSPPHLRVARATEMRSLLERARALADRAEFEAAPDAQARADRSAPGRPRGKIGEAD
ncbi:MAG: hypothetical protein KGI57_10250 [Hyphomicrobiales bacterium]|nr:hypothetical protein [Hyphomicrobiales bacterium]